MRTKKYPSSNQSITLRSFAAKANFLRRGLCRLLLSCSLLFTGHAMAALTINSVTLDGSSSIAVAPGGSSIPVAISVSNDASNSWNSTGWRISTTAPGKPDRDFLPRRARRHCAPPFREYQWLREESSFREIAPCARLLSLPAQRPQKHLPDAHLR